MTAAPQKFKIDILPVDDGTPRIVTNLGLQWLEYMEDKVGYPPPPPSCWRPGEDALLMTGSCIESDQRTSFLSVVIRFVKLLRAACWLMQTSACSADAPGVNAALNKDSIAPRLLGSN